MDVLEHVDERLRDELRADFLRRRVEPADPLPRGVTVVLAGHRAAGKSRLLPLIAERLGRPALDTDRELERRHGKKLSDWVREDVDGFRRAERDLFATLNRGQVVAVGGGFLANSPEVLQRALVVLVPVSFETYVDRLCADATRPRLLPDLSLLDELREVFFEREQKHRLARPLSLVDFLLRLERGQRARRVVTLPPDTDAAEFAWRARHAGADALEVRTDITPLEYDLRSAARALPLIVSQRGATVPEAWRVLADLVDSEEPGTGGRLVSHHAPEVLSTQQAVAHWCDTPLGAFVKHVEPLDCAADGGRLLATQKALVECYGPGHVTVLGVGPLALPCRAVLGRKNALDFLALDGAWQAAPGQRLLEDAVREHRAAVPDERGRTGRLGILGHGLGQSLSPRLHEQPFDRIDLPANADIGALLPALRSHYRGLSVTSPFKTAAARAVGANRAAVNTLVRTPDGWAAYNSDIEGALECLVALVDPAEARRRRHARGPDKAPSPAPLAHATTTVTVLGAGGVTEALTSAAEALGLTLSIRTRASGWEEPLTGSVVWTWPAHVEAPQGLLFRDARVAVIHYGPRAHQVAQTVRSRGGLPVLLGRRWFIAQARRQRALWSAAS